MKNYLKYDANTKVRILKPILDDWNDTITDTWTIDTDKDRGRLTIHRKKKENPNLGGGIHGSMVHAIACICEAYDWVWAIYIEDGEIVVRV